MRVVHLCTDDVMGGAALAAYRLHKALWRAGYDSRMFVARRASSDPSVSLFLPPRDLPARLMRHVRRERIKRDAARYQASRPAGLEVFSDDRSMYGATVLRQLPPCEVVNLHWVAEFVDYGALLPSIARRTPIVWRLSDQNPLTGGCHYDEGCERFTAACGACPQLGSNDEGDLSRRIWQRKRAALTQIPPGRLHFVALSQWMAREVRRSSLLRNQPVTVIPNGVDLDAFVPRDKAAARQKLGIPPNARAVLFSAHSVSNRRKGFAQLVAALRGLHDLPDLFLLSLGHDRPTIEVSVPHLHLGHLRDERAISEAYSAADLFVIPSLQDNLPNTAIESLACGTPVIGFAAGGLTDIVHPGVTGLLAPTGDVAALRDAIRVLLLDEPRRRAMAQACRQVAQTEYAPEVQVRRYVALYESLIVR